MKKVPFVIFIIFLFAPILCFAEQININTASLKELDELTGIGPKYAQAIIDARPFSSVDELDKVKGIGPATLQKIKDQGLACVNCETAVLEKPNIENASSTPATINYPGGIFINEILPAPRGPDETDEWIELYNSNNNDADLSGWQIKDTTGTATTFKIPQSTKILANNYLVFKRPATKIMLNNETDGLNLLTPDNKTADSVNYAKAPTGQSYSKTNSGWKWTVTLTPGAINIIVATAVKTANKDLPNSKKADSNNLVEAGLAGVSQANLSQEETKTENPWFLFFIVLGATIILAAFVLFIKLNFKQTNVRT